MIPKRGEKGCDSDADCWIQCLVVREECRGCKGSGRQKVVEVTKRGMFGKKKTRREPASEKEIADMVPTTECEHAHETVIESSDQTSWWRPKYPFCSKKTGGGDGKCHKTHARACLWAQPNAPGVTPTQLEYPSCTPSTDPHLYPVIAPSFAGYDGAPSRESATAPLDWVPGKVSEDKYRDVLRPQHKVGKPDTPLHHEQTLKNKQAEVDSRDKAKLFDQLNDADRQISLLRKQLEEERVKASSPEEAQNHPVSVQLSPEAVTASSPIPHSVLDQFIVKRG